MGINKSIFYIIMRRCIDVSELFNDIDNLYDLPEIKEKNQIFIDVNIYLLHIIHKFILIQIFSNNIKSKFVIIFIDSI